MHLQKSALALAVAILSPPAIHTALAFDGLPALSVKGFGTFGASGTDTDALGYRLNTSQSNGVTRAWDIDMDSRLGLQLDADFNESWHAGVQWVARNITGDFVEQNLDWAYLRWNAAENLKVRIGRLGYDVFLLADSRNVGYSYPWIAPPHEFYAGLPTYHFDGVDISRKFALGEGFLTVKGFGGYASFQVPSARSVALKAASAVGGIALTYERGNWTGRVGYSYTDTLREAPFKPLYEALANPLVNAIVPGASALNDKLSIRGKAVQFSSVGLAYDDGVWLAHMEASYVDSEVHSFPSVASGYLSLGRRFDTVTLYALTGISGTLNDPVKIPSALLSTPEIEQLRDAANFALNTNGVDEKSVSVGVRWDVYDKIALKTQWSHYWLGRNGSQLWQEPAEGSTPRMEVNVWSVGIDFIF